ncbi:g11021 [Coccomyxa elongata]
MDIAPLYIVLAVVSICFLVLQIWASKRPKGLKAIPKASVLPFVGDSVRLFKDGPRLAQERFEKLGPIWESWLFGERMFFVAKADMLKWCLNKEYDAVESDWPTSTKVLLGRHAVATAAGEHHKLLRKILRPPFSVAAVNDLMPRMADIARRCCDRWATQGRGKGLMFAKDYTFTIALDIILGFDESLLTDATIEGCTEAFAVWNDGLFSFPINMPGTAFHKAIEAKKILMGYLDQNLKLLKEKKRKGLSAASKGEQASCAEGLLEVKDEEGNGLSEDELKDLFLTLLFAGHDTSAATITRLFSELPRHPDVWNRLVAEQQQVVAEHGAQMDGAAVKAMTYTDAVIKEILRLHPIVGGVFRRALADFNLCGYHVPKGSKLFLNLGHAMTNDERWEGETGDLALPHFCPERWLSEAGTRTGAWMPFGGGPRMCLGYLLATAEIKVLLAVMARGYEWRPVDINEPFGCFPLGGHPTNGLPMDFIKQPQPRV